MSARSSPRLAFVDALRGWAFALMALNHTAFAFLGDASGAYRVAIVFVTVSLAAPLFLFLVGFSLALSGARHNGNGGRYRRHLIRGLVLVALGFAVDLVAGQEPAGVSGGILQTIGVSVICLAPFVPLLHRRAARLGLLTAAVALYPAFVLLYPVLLPYLETAPLLNGFLFNGFPPWPWVGAVMIGLVAGADWPDETESARRSARRIGETGALCVAIYLVFAYGVTDNGAFGFASDFIINGHWLPGPVTIFLVAGGVAVNFFLIHHLVERAGLRLRWLQSIGRSALPLYVVHLVLIRTVGERLLGINADGWWQFAALNLALLALVVLIAEALARWRRFRTARPGLISPAG